MRKAKGIFLNLVLTVIFLFPVFWGSGVYASQLTFNYDIECPDAYQWFYDVAPFRYRYIFPGVSGTLVGTPVSPGLLSQQIIIPASLDIWVETGVGLTAKGPDLITVPLTSIGMNLPPGALSLDQTGPLRFTDAHWSVSVRQDGTLHSFYNEYADADMLLHGGDFPYPTGGGYSLGSSIEIPIDWVNTSIDPVSAPNWLGFGNGAVNFDLIITQGGNVVPLPGSLVLFGSGLLGWLGWRLKAKTA